jgi:hypothetical protein
MHKFLMGIPSHFESGRLANRPFNRDPGEASIFGGREFCTPYPGRLPRVTLAVEQVVWRPKLNSTEVFGE